MANVNSDDSRLLQEDAIDMIIDDDDDSSGDLGVAKGLPSQKIKPKDDTKLSTVTVQSVPVQLSGNTTERQTSEVEIIFKNKKMESEYKRLISERQLETAKQEDEHENNQSSFIVRILTQRDIRRNWKVFFGSFLLTVVGLVLITAGFALGIMHGFSSDLKSIVFLVAGGLCFIPGAYHFIYMCCAANGARGFRFNRLPTLR